MAEMADSRRADVVLDLIERIREVAPKRRRWWSPWRGDKEAVIDGLLRELLTYAHGGIGLLAIAEFKAAIEAHEALGLEVRRWNEAKALGASVEGLREVRNAELDAAIDRITEVRRLMFALVDQAIGE